MRDMSTPVGHSRRQPLQLTHRSSTSYMRYDVTASRPSCPVNAWRKTLARPRVTCSSSCVTIYDGHITSEFLRHAPLLLHISTAPEKPPHSDQSRTVSSLIGS